MTGSRRTESVTLWCCSVFVAPFCSRFHLHISTYVCCVFTCQCTPSSTIVVTVTHPHALPYHPYSFHLSALTRALLAETPVGTCCVAGAVTSVKRDFAAKCVGLRSTSACAAQSAWFPARVPGLPADAALPLQAWPFHSSGECTSPLNRARPLGPCTTAKAKGRSKRSSISSLWAARGAEGGKVRWVSLRQQREIGFGALSRVGTEVPAGPLSGRPSKCAQLGPF